MKNANPDVERGVLVLTTAELLKELSRNQLALLLNEMDTSQLLDIQADAFLMTRYHAHAGDELTIEGKRFEVVLDLDW